MDDNSLLVIILAFIVGCMCSGMMKQMCDSRLVEGSSDDDLSEEGSSDDDLSELPVKKCGYRPFGREKIMNSKNLEKTKEIIANNFDLLKYYLDCEAGRDVALYYE